jgi:hypothetical protein
LYFLFLPHQVEVEITQKTPTRLRLVGAGDPSGAVFSPGSTFFIFLIYFF